MQGTHRPRLEWTRRQKEVLDLLAQGLTNAEIGQRLGISLDGAKWHVSEILGHLGVDSREAAAAYWREERQPMRRLARFGSGLGSALGGAGKAVTIGGGLLAAAGLAAGLVFYAQRDADDPSAASPTAESLATPGPAASTTPGTSAQAPIHGCPVDQSICDFALEQERNVQARDIAALIERSPWQRSGDTASFVQWFDRTFPASEPHAQLVSIGCPRTSEIGSTCDDAFALAFSYLTPATAGETGPGIGFLNYRRAANGDPELLAVTSPSSPDRRPALDGVSLPGLSCFNFQVPALGPCSEISWQVLRRSPVSGGSTSTLQGVPVVDLQLGDPWELPEGLRVYTSTIAYATDFMPNPPEKRRFVTLGGQLVADDLFARLKTLAGTTAAPWSWAADERFETIVAVVEGGRLYRSTDGGASWRLVTELPSDTNVVGPLNIGTLVVTGQSEMPLPTNYRYWILETGADVIPPKDATTSFIRGGELFWSVGVGTFEHVVDASGQVVFEPDLTGIDSYLQVVDTFVSGDLLTGWSTSGTGYIARHSPTGDLQSAWRWTGSEVIWVKAVISDDLVLVNVLPPRGSRGTNLNLQVGIVDLRNGVLHFLPQLSEGRTDNLSPFVDGVVAASTMQVNAGGECLNLRSEPRLDAPLVACIPDGMLVDDLRRQQPPEVEGGIGGRQWNAVRAPGYGNGWVAGEFLRR